MEIIECLLASLCIIGALWIKANGVLKQQVWEMIEHDLDEYLIELEKEKRT